MSAGTGHCVPKISVVTSAYNAANILGDTLHSVLDQDSPAFELIVIDDGSTDSTQDVINECIRPDSNVTFLRQEHNLGLTASLVRGCAHARGKYIARIDAGDKFLPGRLRQQYDLMESNPGVGLVSCGTRFVSADGEWLYDVSQQPDELGRGLQQTELRTITGPSHHGSTMFRREVYEAVGGYRTAFHVAQDLDLWLRISEVSKVLAMPEVLYESRILPGSISIGRRQRQLETTNVILLAALQRRIGEPEPDLNQLLLTKSKSKDLNARHAKAQYEYFVGGCLSKRDKVSALQHFKRAWRQLPWNPRYAIKYWMNKLA